MFLRKIAIEQQFLHLWVSVCYTNMIAVVLGNDDRAKSSDFHKEKDELLQYFTFIYSFFSLYNYLLSEVYIVYIVPYQFLLSMFESSPVP
jgi:hypothetical protein